MALTSEPTHQHDTRSESDAPERPEAAGLQESHHEEPLAEDEVLLEEISIDGMCGVY
ncbi:MAG: mycofactocin precursor MftA [Acidimicrobiia bacterium]